MLLDLSAQDSARALERRLRHYARPTLLCVDEVGYLSYDARAADLLFEVVSRRYEKKSLVITTNLAFKDWPTIFPNASCVTALIDRLTHHADICLIEGQSFRRREAEAPRRPSAARIRGGSGETSAPLDDGLLDLDVGARILDVLVDVDVLLHPVAHRLLEEPEGTLEPGQRGASRLEVAGLLGRHGT